MPIAMTVPAAAAATLENFTVNSLSGTVSGAATTIVAAGNVKPPPCTPLPTGLTTSDDGKKPPSVPDRSSSTRMDGGMGRAESGRLGEGAGKGAGPAPHGG